MVQPGYDILRYLIENLASSHADEKYSAVQAVDKICRTLSIKPWASGGRLIWHFRKYAVKRFLNLCIHWQAMFLDFLINMNKYMDFMYWIAIFLLGYFKLRLQLCNPKRRACTLFYHSSQRTLCPMDCAKCNNQTGMWKFVSIGEVKKRWHD